MFYEYLLRMFVHADLQLNNMAFLYEKINLQVSYFRTGYLFINPQGAVLDNFILLGNSLWHSV